MDTLFPPHADSGYLWYDNVPSTCCGEYCFTYDGIWSTKEFTQQNVAPCMRRGPVTAIKSFAYIANSESNWE